MKSAARWIVCFGMLAGCTVDPAKIVPQKLLLPPGIAAQQVISAAKGGIIEVTDDPALKGTKVIIPAGALDKDTLITIGKVTNPPANEDKKAVDAGPAVQFGPEGLTFKVPVEIRLSYSLDDLKKENLTAQNAYPHYFNPTSGVWEKLDPVKTDPETVGANVNHFSTYRIYGLLMNTADNVVNLVKVTPNHRYLLPGQTYLFTAEAYTAGGALIEGATVTWRTSNAAVATVNDGTATGVAIGTVTIYAKVENVEGTAAIEVVDRIPVGPPPVVDFIDFWSDSGLGYFCEWIWDPQTDTEQKVCNNKVIVFASARDDGSVIHVGGSYLFGQDGPNATLGAMILSFSAASGRAVTSAVSYEDWSDISAPLTTQFASFNVPANVESGTLEISAPGGNFSIPFVVWTKPVVLYVYPSIQTPCELADDPTMTIWGANFTGDVAVSIAGATHALADTGSSYVAVQLSAATQGGLVVAATALGSSSQNATDLGIDSPIFTRYEGAWLYDYTPRVITNETSVTFRGCGFTGASLKITDSVNWSFVDNGVDFYEIPPQPSDFSVASSTDVEVVSAGVPGELAFLAVTTPASPWISTYAALPHADALEWELPQDHSAFAVSDLAGEVFTFALDSLGEGILSRLAYGSATSAVSFSMPGHFIYGEPQLLALDANTFVLIQSYWSDTAHVDIDRIEIDWVAGTGVMNHLYDLLDADLQTAVATTDSIFLALRASTCCSDGFDLVRAGTAGGTTDLLASSLANLRDLEVAGQTLVVSTTLWDDMTYQVTHRLLTLPVTSASFADASLVAENTNEPYGQAGAFSLYHNRRNGNVYVHQVQLFEDPAYGTSASDATYTLNLSGTIALNPLNVETLSSIVWWDYDFSLAPIYNDDTQVIRAQSENDMHPYQWGMGWQVLEQALFGGATARVWAAPNGTAVFPYGANQFLFLYGAEIPTSWSPNGVPQSTRSLRQLYRRQ